MIRVRFAPSPTGYLHIGNVRTALFNYLFAQHEGGKFILRIEDTDKERSRPEFIEGLVEDLAWMGIRWDEGPGIGGDSGPYQQSERLEIYRKFLRDLIQKGKAYECYVTEEEIEEMKRQARLEKKPPRFDNRGRNFSREEIEKRRARGIRPTVRFKIENPRLKVHDLIRGGVEFNLDEMAGDFVIQRADGLPTFHLAVCVDDGLMKITHVIRGEDHLSNTPKHILLLEAMGFKPPQYGHLSLIHGPGGEPLSKRLEAVSVREFRRRGVLPEALANYIALLGWAPGQSPGAGRTGGRSPLDPPASGGDREIFTWEELKEAFDLKQVNKSASLYDPHKLDWVNGEHLRKLPDEDFSRRALAYLKAEKKLKWDETEVHRVLPVFKDNITRFEELEERLRILEDNFSYEDPALIKTETAREIFKAVLSILPTVRGEGEALFESLMNALKPQCKARGKELFMPFRMALTGRAHGPELKRIVPVLGLERCRRRFERALQT
ncbi:MAG: glutamate--tRNA ligase [Candidatus Omnitrophica bacterium]|nr:glutamate--tRNA ligase [Candidatus Omnitrophota bacterium]